MPGHPQARPLIRRTEARPYEQLLGFASRTSLLSSFSEAMWHLLPTVRVMAATRRD